MSRLILFVALMLASAACLGQIGDVPQQDGSALGAQANSSAHTIRGQVINSITGQPIARALVQLGSQHAALTDHEGQFEFDNVTETYGIFIAAKPGYFAGAPEAIGPSLLAAKSQPISLNLTPEAILSGTAVDPNGQPIQGLRVQLKMLQIRDGLSHWQQMQSTTTNAEGEFRFAGLQAGKYSLSTGLQLDGLPDAASSVAFVPIAYPPVSADESAGALTLAPGNHIEAGLSPPVERLYPVTGRVDGPITRGIGFEAETRGGQQFSPVVRFNPQTSEFRLLLPNGSYRLKLRAYLPPQQMMIGMRDISIGGAPLDGISISLAPLAAIPVEVEYQTVNTTDHASAATASSHPLFVNVSLEEVDPVGPVNVLTAQPPRSAGMVREPQPDDPLTIQNVAPGHYQLRVNSHPPWYVASASCGNVDLTREPLGIAGSAAGCTIHAVMRDDSASLRWSISNSQEKESGTVFVYAVPLGNLEQTVSPSATQPQRTGSAAQGSFEGLAPGRYLVIAFKQRQELPYRDAGAVQRYSPLGKEVTLTPNSKSDVELDVVAGEP